MNLLLELGPYFFSIPIVFFGLQYFRYGRYVGGMPPVPPWAPGGAAGAYVVGALLIGAGLSILIGKRARWGAALIGGLFLFCVVVFHSPRIHDILYSGTERTRALEPLALSGAAFALISLLPGDRDGSLRLNHTSDWLTRAGRWLFALSMIVFGVQHFLYAGFINTLIPSWIPAHWFWVYFTGVGMILVGLALIVGMLGRLAATWLGIMFLLWTVLLHAPRVVAALHNGDEWNSAFVALAFSGASFIVARTLRVNAAT
jgi:uncharacterized membrane protein YphA (DoxX/SURF4 family)